MAGINREVIDNFYLNVNAFKNSNSSLISRAIDIIISERKKLPMENLDNFINKLLQDCGLNSDPYRVSMTPNLFLMCNS